jgi:hypothetical protein
MRRLVLIVLGLGVIALPGVMMQPALSLQVMTGDGVTLICSRVTPGTPITLQFTHSMYGGFVQEMYRIDEDGKLVRERFVTGNAAAAEYYATDGRTSHVEDGYEVAGEPFVTDNLIVRVDDRGDHWLTIGEARYHLAAMLPGSTQIHIHGGRTSGPELQSPCP